MAPGVCTHHCTLHTVAHGLIRLLPPAQVYKALNVIEFLIKNGSERVIDDCRYALPAILDGGWAVGRALSSHPSPVRTCDERYTGRDHMFQLRLLQDFKFIEDSGSDQGINGKHTRFIAEWPFWIR